MYAVLGLMLVAMAVAQKSLSCAYMKDAPLCCVQDLSLGEADPCNQWEDGFNAFHNLTDLGLLHFCLHRPTSSELVDTDAFLLHNCAPLLEFTPEFDCQQSCGTVGCGDCDDSHGFYQLWNTRLCFMALECQGVTVHPVNLAQEYANVVKYLNADGQGATCQPWKKSNYECMSDAQTYGGPTHADLELLEKRVRARVLASTSTQ